MQSNRNLPTFRSNVLPPIFSTLQIICTRLYSITSQNTLFLPLLFLTLLTFAFQAQFTGFYFLLLHDVTPLHAIYVITFLLALKLQHFSLLRDYKSYSTVLSTV